MSIYLHPLSSYYESVQLKKSVEEVDLVLRGTPCPLWNPGGSNHVCSESELICCFKIFDMLFFNKEIFKMHFVVSASFKYLH